MAPELSTKDQLAQLRRMIAQKPYVAPETVAESATRTPNVTRFIKARQMRLQSEASPSASVSPHMTGMAGKDNSLTRPAQVKVSAGGDRVKVRSITQENEPKLIATKKHFTTSRRVEERQEGAGVDAPKPLLQRTPVTSQQGVRRFLLVKGCQDIYDLPQDDSSSTTAPAREAPSQPHHKLPPANTIYEEPKTSSFHYLNTPSSRSQERRTLEECLHAAPEACQAKSKSARSSQSHNPAQETSRSTFIKNATTEYSETPLGPQQ